jgi:tripartite ATP-independent transporter DctM subunit
MSAITAGLIGVGILFLLIFMRMPIAFAMALVGFVGFFYLGSSQGALSIMARETFTTVSSYDFAVLPLFILMGQVAFQSGLSKKLYYSGYKWLGHLPGGLALATIAGCAVFAAGCGSGLATAATMGAVALPEMKRYKYDPALATGCIASGGTIGILIPPSGLLIIYGILTEQSISKLFISGILPGVLLSVLFMLTIYVWVKLRPATASSASKASFRERVASLGGTGEMLILFLIIMGGLYGGIFTPNEAGGIGAAGALVIGWVRRGLSWRGFNAALTETGKTTAMIFAILIGAMIFNRFLAVSTIPEELVALTSRLPFPPLAIIGVLVFVYMVLGALFDEVAITLLTIPIFFPVVLSLGIHPIWFGVLFCICMEMGMILPPIGINVFVIAGVAKDVPMYTIYRGILPFIIPMLVTIGLLMIFPQIALFLPGLMK